MSPEKRPFLTAEWRWLLMFNYEVDAGVLAPLLPAGAELDLWEGRAIASVVGFLFQKARVLGVPVPLHTTFEEVNLRFYARARVGAEWRRGVVFVKELVPRLAVASAARLIYAENYAALPMGHTIEVNNSHALRQDGLVEYTWRHDGRLSRMGGLASGDPAPAAPGSEEEFITAQSWGFTRLRSGKTGAYEVVHTDWRLWQVAQPYLLCNVQALYGEGFAPFLRRPPRSAYLADGAPVAVYPREMV